MPPIFGIQTSSTAFVGTSVLGLYNQPVQLFNFYDFQDNFGNLTNDSDLAYSVHQFFINGGREAWVIRIPDNPTETHWREGVLALDIVDLFNLLVLPGIASQSVLTMAANYCEQRRAFLIIDSPKQAKMPEDVRDAVEAGQFTRSINAAIYFPWIKIADPLSNASPRLSPPSGSIAGLISRLDSNGGRAWKPPAGTDATLIGVQGLECALTDQQVALLSPRGINCIRSFPSGYLAWGARTLVGDDANASDWKYINVRRLGLFLEESVYRGTKWAASEPNGESLWAHLRESVEMFMRNLWQMGTLAGQTPDEAYFVKCDSQTTTQNDLNLGIVNIVLAFAPIKPAAFIIIKIKQFTA